MPNVCRQHLVARARSREEARAPVFARRRGSRGASLRLGRDAEVVSHAAMAPDVAAGLQRARVELGQI